MNTRFSNLGRHISILDRLMKMYYNRCLEDYEIGWGQQFYVEYLYDCPGATAQDMVEHFKVDKATLTKTIKKLLEIDYITVESDNKDKRVKHLYLSEKAFPAAERIKEIHSEFHKVLSEGLSEEDIAAAEKLMERMTDNINKKIWHRMERTND